MRRATARNQAERPQAPGPVGSGHPVDTRSTGAGADASAAADAAIGGAGSTGSGNDSMNELLRRLENAANLRPADQTDDLAHVSSEASGHADAMKATLAAQREAQEMLTRANQERAAAAEQAEQLVREAQELADRLREEARQHAERARKETSDWAADQRRTIDSVVGELVDSATRDADEIRAEALRTAMDEAERTASQYVALAAAGGARDAEAIRQQARDLLHRSSTLVTQAQASIRELSTTMSAFVADMDRQHQSMQTLLAEAAKPVEAGAAAVPSPAEVAPSAIASATATLDRARAETGDAPTGDAAGNAPVAAQPTAPAPATTEASNLDSHDDRHEEAVAEDTTAAAEPAATQTPDYTAERPAAGRPLGSLFRGTDRA